MYLLRPAACFSSLSRREGQLASVGNSTKYFGHFGRNLVRDFASDEDLMTLRRLCYLTLASDES